MARLLRDKDYFKVSLSDNFRELINNNYTEWLDAEQVAQSEMKSKLAQRYIVDQVFTDTTKFDPTLVYKAKKLVEYTELPWDDTVSYTGFPIYDNSTFYANGTQVNYYGYVYTLNQFGGSTGVNPTNAIWIKGAATKRSSYKGGIYECIANTTGNIPTNTTYWSFICDDLSLFYVTLPNPEWNKDATYAIGNKVWFLDKNYTALQSNNNILPTSNPAIWGTGTSFTIASGVFPDNILFWTKGDNRNPLIIRFLLDITRYHFERSIPAANVSDLIKEAYNGNTGNETGGAIGWLKRVSSGTDNADLPEIYNNQGLSILSGQTRDKQGNYLW